MDAHSVLYCVAVCCSVLQYVAMCSRSLQCVAVCWSLSQWAAKETRKLIAHCFVMVSLLDQKMHTVHFTVLQCAAVCCSVLQCVAVC